MSKFSHLFTNQSPYEERMAYIKPLVQKWAKTGLLEGLDTDYDISTVSIMLENQIKQLIKEVSVTGTTANQEQWSGIALPLVRRIFAEFAGKEFVSVQPMNLPSGLVFFMDFKYGSDRSWRFGYAPTSASQQGTLHGITNTGSAPSDGLYGAGKFGYSINDQTATIASGSATTGSVAVTFADVNFDANLSASYAAGKLRWITIASSSLTGLDTKAVRGFALVSGSGATITTYPAFTKVSGANILFLTTTDDQTFGVTGEVRGTTTVHYFKQPATDYDRNDFETTRTETALSIPQVELDFRQEPIIAKTRKLQGIWTPEFAQDINAYQSVDVESEVTGVMSEYVSMEIDLEILDMLRVNAQTVDYWSAQINNVLNAAGTAFVQQSAAYYPTQNQWFQTLGTKMQKISNKIHTKTMRGGANFAVMSPDVATIVESIPGYAADTDGDKFKFAMGVQKIGSINNRFQIYKNPYMQENTILMGYRGTQFLETGAVYAPYVPLIMTPLLLDPTNYTPRRAVMTRYALKMVRPEFFGLVGVADLNVI